MALPDEHKWRYIFHFTDIENLDSIIKNGLLSTNAKNALSIKHKNIANKTIQKRRSNMDVPVGAGGKVHDYVPFYFSSINPMLLRQMNEKNVDQNLIIYFCVKIQRLVKEDAVFTSASANTNDPPTFYGDVKDLDKLDWQAIDKKAWGVASDEERHKKMAEALIHKKVNIHEIDAILVFNNEIKIEVKKVFDENGVQPPAIIFDGDKRVMNYRFYYKKFFISGQKYCSLVTGPLTLLSQYKNLIQEIKDQRQEDKKSYPYKTIKDLLDALGKDITVIPELKAVENLLQDYEPHNDTVGDHTKNVVAMMKKQNYYNIASDEKKDILLLSSYLHDIGKGPKNKWKDGKMNRAYPDHPADAIPMLKRILIDEIENLSDEEIRLVCMLVIYHDVVGDCIEKERDINQVVKVIDNVDDLEMLFAIACADVETINHLWGNDMFCKKSIFFEEVLQLKQA